MKLKTLGLAVAFIGCILAANYVTSRYGMVPVGFGLTATAGTYFAGLSFVLRDSLHDAAGKWEVLRLIVEGALVSAVLALTIFRADESHLPPGVTALSIATASGIAFLLSETADLCIYEPLRKRGYVRAAVASNIVGAIVDTFAFLAIAGFPVMAALSGQLVGKILISTVAVLLVGIERRRRRTRAVWAT